MIPPTNPEETLVSDLIVSGPVGVVCVVVGRGAVVVVMVEEA